MQFTSKINIIIHLKSPSNHPMIACLNFLCQGKPLAPGSFKKFQETHKMWTHFPKP